MVDNIRTPIYNHLRIQIKNHISEDIMDSKKKTLKITMCALFAALTAICSQIQIPLPQIPINLALFSVCIAGAVLGAAYGALSMIVYVLLGAVGVPVFAGFKGGFAAITGSTGGYIVGYIVCAWVTGIIVKNTKGKIYQIALAMVVGVALCYVLGTIWFMILSGNPLKVSLGFCVFPFLPGDAIKIILASTISAKLRQGVSNIYELNPCKISTNTTGEIAK